ncbi:hypothetical protein ABPG74_006669 [Tetrahymena malaccensis]
MTLLKLLLAFLLVSQIFCAGADVTCSADTCTEKGTCPDAPTVPKDLSWVKGKDAGKCAINKCPEAGTASGITGATDLFCQSCPGTSSGQFKAIYANSAQTGCVASSSTCGKDRKANTWTDDDCLACQGEQNKYAKEDKSGCQATAPKPSPAPTPTPKSTPGADVTCSADTCTEKGTCPDAPTVPKDLSWVKGKDAGKCAINKCPEAGTASGITGATDLFCQSCPGTSSGQIKAIYANIAQNGCVASSSTCGKDRKANTWTDDDCLACQGEQNKYAKEDKSGCQATAPKPTPSPAPTPKSTPGADVTCSSTTCTEKGTCPDAPTAPEDLSWVKGKESGKCAINKCPEAGTESGITGATDLFCQSCPGTPSGQVKAVYANTEQTGCVASSSTCGKDRKANTWTDADCLACQGESNQYAKEDKSGCQETAPKPSPSPVPTPKSTPGADVTCSAATCTEKGTCPDAPTAPLGLSWANGKESGKCAINNCPEVGTQSGITGASDLFCKSCPGTPNGSVQAVFANSLGTGCVASNQTCGKNRTANSWNNADCLACNGKTNQYAKLDKSGCQSVAPSTSSSSIIIFSITLFLISFLF